MLQKQAVFACVDPVSSCAVSLEGNCADELKIIAGPYLQYPTETTITVAETNQPASSRRDKAGPRTLWHGFPAKTAKPFTRSF